MWRLWGISQGVHAQGKQRWGEGSQKESSWQGLQKHLQEGGVSRLGRSTSVFTVRCGCGHV